VDLFLTYEWTKESAVLSGDEAKHCSRVFRHGPGEPILLTDGQGHRIEATISEVTKKEVYCRVDHVEKVGSQRPYQMDIAIAPTKNAQRMEWLVEKGVEIGLDRLFFIQSFHSERKKVRLDRMRRIALAALKQSQQFVLPEIHELQAFDEFVQKEREGQKIMAHLSEESQAVEEVLQAKNHYIFLIGPEGDFSEEEIKLAQRNDWQLCSLGDRRLRTETAGLFALSFASFINMNS
jgi:16S rRNA (uracil1498-N3)-methyltransferase